MLISIKSKNNKRPLSFRIKFQRRFDLGTEDGGGDLINDDCYKYDEDDDDCDNCGDNTSCNASIINFENLMFPFSIR